MVIKNTGEKEVTFAFELPQLDSRYSYDFGDEYSFELIDDRKVYRIETLVPARSENGNGVVIIEYTRKFVEESSIQIDSSDYFRDILSQYFLNIDPKDIEDSPLKAVSNLHTQVTARAQTIISNKVKIEDLTRRKNDIRKDLDASQGLDSREAERNSLMDELISKGKEIQDLIEEQEKLKEESRSLVKEIVDTLSEEFSWSIDSKRQPAKASS